MTRHVPISEFKDHASEWIAAAESGEDVVITRHGKPAARLSAVPRVTDEQRNRAREALARMAEMRKQLKAQGMTATIEEMIAWKNEGQR
jgi:prevent-host-death family protein